MFRVTRTTNKENEMGRLSDRLNESGGITDLENETIDASIEHQIKQETQEVA